MMDKLAKAQKNWMSKLVLILTALSFMSLFGVSGYLTGASCFRPSSFGYRRAAEICGDGSFAGL